MSEKKKWMLLAVITGIVCVSCRGNTGSVMKLTKAEGSVDIQDESLKSVSTVENMNLYNGYDLNTGMESYAWIDVDHVKLAKMDEVSRVKIGKEGKDLELFVDSGNLYFHITEPLGEDETLNIRASDMMVGIRGTCGWVEAENEQRVKVYILEGTVECSMMDAAGNRTVTKEVSEGEVAQIFSEGQRSMSVDRFTEFEIPVFVKEEVTLDEEFCKNIYETSGLDLFMDTEESNPILTGDLSNYLGLYDLIRESENSYIEGELRMTAVKISDNEYVFRSEDIQKVFEDGEYIGFNSRLPDGVEIYSFRMGNSDDLADSVNGGVKGTMAFTVSADKDVYIKIR